MTKSMTVIVALGAAIGLSAAAHAQSWPDDRGLQRRARVVVVTPDPYWVPDFNIVPRYRYRPEDDRVDPYGKPLAPRGYEPGGFGIGQ